MGLRHAALVAGLTLGLMGGTAKAANLTYYVDYTVSGPLNITVGGSIVTDGKIGTLSATDIVSYDIEIGADDLNKSDSTLTLGGNSLFANSNGSLVFTFPQAADNSSFLVNSSTSPQSGIYFESIVTQNPIGELGAFESNGKGANEYVFSAETVTIATLSTVPLPASAPMFGAALLALGTVGYGLKRKRAAAA